MSQTDAQAALAAASEVMGAFLRSSSSPRLTAQQAQQWTIGTADAFLSWLQHGRPAPDERLIPNEDFRSPSAARTERINPNDVTFAAERARVTQIMASVDVGGLHSLKQRLDYAGPHDLAPEHRTTPSGARACLCGEKWPCSQYLAGRP